VSHDREIGPSLLSSELKEQIKRVERSVIGVNAKIRYEIHTYEYALENGHVIPDPNSPVGYRLRRQGANGGIKVDRDERMLSGGGVILGRNLDLHRYVILTSSHLVSPRDTTNIYYVDEQGAKTDVLFQRQIVTDVEVSARGVENWRVNANLVANDPIDDLALILAETERNLGPEYPNDPDYETDLSWGDWVFLFGYPREIKQMTGGWVSESPYGGTFAVDAVVRFGFSGGPIFAVSDDGPRLALVGLVKSVPSSHLDYISPDLTLPVGYGLRQEDLPKLTVKRQVMVEYGAAYCVNARRIRQFLRATRTTLDCLSVKLDDKYF